MRYEKGTFITVPNKVQMRSLSLGARAVFIEMCEMSNDNGVCFPSRKLLGERIQMSQDSVDRFIEELLVAGFITKTHRKGEKGNYTSNLYQIMILEGVAAPMPIPSRTDTATPSRTHAHLTVSNRTESIERGEAKLRGFDVVPDTQEVTREKKPPKYPHALEVFAWFPSPQPSWRINTTELKHAELLWVRGEAEVKKRLAYLERHAGEDFLPTVLKPSDLERKWLDLSAYAKRNR